MKVSEWKDQIKRERKMKDAFFAEHWQSPIPPQDRIEFKGLDYYPINPEFLFELELHEHEEKKVIRMAYSKGSEQNFLRWGEFRFNVGGKEQALQAYTSDPEDERLFILFKDATSGKETYGAGRYIDLEPDRNRTAEGKWILDFNRAYNPWCVYSEDYICPLVPPENCLEVPILAGEKDYPLKEKRE